MQRRQALFGVLGLVLAASAAGADVPKEVTILGQKYALTANPIGGKYKNGPTLVQTEDEHKGGDLAFVPGTGPEADRLFVAFAHPANDDTWTANQFSLLTGTDANGVFSPATSNLTEFFGGNVDRNRGGRIATVTFISDVDTGKKKDRNIALSTFTDDDTLRFYDLDTMTGDFIGDSIHNLVQRCINADEGDPGMPSCGFVMGAPGPNGTLIFVGRGEGEGPQLGILDPARDKFFNVLTNVGTATAEQTTPINIDLDPHDFERLNENEYLMLTRAPAGLADAERTAQVLYRLRITPPADPSTAEPQSVKVEVTGAEELLATNPDDLTITKDLLGVGPRGIAGMAVGRAVAENGPKRLYFLSGTGTLITATPVVTPPAAGN
jgi:hypothetical protein